MSGMASTSSGVAKQKPFSRPSLGSEGGDELVDLPMAVKKSQNLVTKKQCLPDKQTL
jgi:hypothetical protein